MKLINSQHVDQVDHYSFGTKYLNIQDYLEILIFNFKIYELKTLYLGLYTTSKKKHFQLNGCRLYWELQLWYIYTMSTSKFI